MRSVSHGGQTISVYTLRPTRCQRSYTNSTDWEKIKTSQRLILSFFIFSPLQMKSHWKGLSLTVSRVLSWLPSVKLWSTTETRQTPLLWFFLSTFPKNFQLPHILYMGGTIIPGIAALWERKEGWWRGWVNRILRNKERKKKHKGQSCDCWVTSVIKTVTWGEEKVL